MWFQIVILIFGVLFTIIGFFLSMAINRNNKKLDDIDDTLKEHRSMIDQNKADIKANSDMDTVTQKFFENTLTRLESLFKETLLEIKNEMKDLRTGVKEDVKEMNTQIIAIQQQVQNKKRATKTD